MNRDLDLGDIRRDYDKYFLHKEDLPKNPMDLFKAWFARAEETEKDPTAMVLSTALDGQPNSRVVLLKKIEGECLVFFSNYQSSKGLEMDANNQVALNFYWPDSERQIRFRGTASRISAEASDEYFYSRPKDSQVGATLSDQSREMESREEFEKMVDSTMKEYEGKPVVRPEYWGGYQVEAFDVEFWQGRTSRLHDRFLYERENGLWKISRLNP